MFLYVGDKLNQRHNIFVICYHRVYPSLDPEHHRVFVDLLVVKKICVLQVQLDILDKLFIAYKGKIILKLWIFSFFSFFTEIYYQSWELTFIGLFGACSSLTFSFSYINLFQFNQNVSHVWKKQLWELYKEFPLSHTMFSQNGSFP